MNEEKFTCNICASSVFFSDEAFNHLVKVFSDCREFSGRVDLVICNICGAAQKKLTDASWNEICSMYRDYSAYSLSKGLEQKVFDVSEYGAARSDQILSHLGDWFGKVLSGRALDFGCGNGSIFPSLSKHLPGWDLYGLEVTERNFDPTFVSAVRSIVFGEIENAPGKFDLITLFHVLEHADDFKCLLVRIGKKLTPDGMVLIQVPNWILNPFDFAIADHLNHFRLEHLIFIIKNLGFQVLVKRDDIIKKELTILIKRDDDAGAGSNFNNQEIFLSSVETARSIKQFERSLNSLMAFLKICSVAIDQTSQDQRVYIFGSSIGARWTFSNLTTQRKRKVIGFIDDDISRYDSLIDGKPICDFSTLKRRDLVLIPGVPSLVDKCRVRAQGLGVNVVGFDYVG